MNASSSTIARGSAALAMAAGLGAAYAQGTQAGTTARFADPCPVVVIVRVAKPWYAPRAIVTAKMRDTIPTYARLPGLLFKAFSFERESSDFGGIYFWRDRASADAWFDPAWFARVRKERGVQAQVSIFDAPVSLDNVAGGTQADDDSKTVATLVEVPAPTALTREGLTAGFTAALPTYQGVPGLLRKYFTISSTGSFGGVYLWKDEASARAWFDGAWHARVVATYGQDAKIAWFDTPILLPTRDAANAAAAKALTAAAP